MTQTLPRITMTKYRFDGQTLQRAVGCASAHRSERTAPNIGSRPTGRGRESHPPWGGRTRSGADAPAGHLTDVCPVIPAKAGASQGKRDKCSGISRPGLRAGTSTSLTQGEPERPKRHHKRSRIRSGTGGQAPAGCALAPLNQNSPAPPPAWPTPAGAPSLVLR